MTKLEEALAATRPWPGSDIRTVVLSLTANGNVNLNAHLEDGEMRVYLRIASPRYKNIRLPDWRDIADLDWEPRT